jgi:hypothetical protein
MKTLRRVALMLGLQSPLKWHTLIISGTQRYSHEHDWESTIKEYVVETLAAHNTK